LVKAWDFAVPFSSVVLGPNRFLFKFSKQEHISKIFKHTTWNVIGSLLVLQCWSLAATLNELQFNKSHFWIQIHGLPLLNMSIKNTIAIGKGLGTLFKVDGDSGGNETFRSYLRLLVEIDVT
jgi:hypothetical protein